MYTLVSLDWMRWLDDYCVVDSLCTSVSRRRISVDIHVSTSPWSIYTRDSEILTDELSLSEIKRQQWVPLPLTYLQEVGAYLH